MESIHVVLESSYNPDDNCFNQDLYRFIKQVLTLSIKHDRYPMVRVLDCINMDIYLHCIWQRILQRIIFPDKYKSGYSYIYMKSDIIDSANTNMLNNKSNRTFQGVQQEVQPRRCPAGPSGIVDPPKEEG